MFIGIAATAAVAGGDIKKTIRAKGQLAAVMVAVRLRKRDYDFLTAGVRLMPFGAGKAGMTKSLI